MNDENKVICSRCSRDILKTTYEGTNGLCMPCYNKSQQKYYIIPIVICILLSSLIFIYFLNKDNKNNIESNDSSKNKKILPDIPFIQASKENTLIVSNLYETIPKEKNLIYCATIQLAWNEFRNTVKIAENTSPPKIIQHLDEKLITSEDLSKEDYIIESGNLKETKNKLNEIFKTRFKDKLLDTSVDSTNFPDNSLLFYAFLKKTMEFKTEFQSFNDPIKFESNKVSYPEAFGIDNFKSSFYKHKSLSSQVSIIDYKNDDDFIVSLSSKKESDIIVLAKIIPETTLIETINHVLNRMETGWESEIKDSETLKIPKFHFKSNNNFLELEKYISGITKSPSQVIQKNLFSLNEKGAVLESDSSIICYSIGMSDDPIYIRNLIFNKPFLLFLKEKKSKYPYFVMWVNNTELMLK